MVASSYATADVQDIRQSGKISQNNGHVIGEYRTVSLENALQMKLLGSAYSYFKATEENDCSASNAVGDGVVLKKLRALDMGRPQEFL